KDTLPVRYDAEIPAVIHAVFRALDIGAFTIQINNRKLMRGFLEGVGIPDSETQTRVLREVDKLDKRGAEHVHTVLTGETFGLSRTVAQRLLDFVKIRSASLSNAHAELDALKRGSETFEQGRSELREVLDTVAAFGVPESAFALNLSIARGLDYYTGTVYETTLNDHPQIGSICSGGRYDNLAGQYTKSKLPGVGISIGLTRLFWQLREAGLLQAASGGVEVLVTQMDDARWPECPPIASVVTSRWWGAMKKPVATRSRSRICAAESSSRCRENSSFRSCSPPWRKPERGRERTHRSRRLAPHSRPGRGDRAQRRTDRTG